VRSACFTFFGAFGGISLLKLLETTRMAPIDRDLLEKPKLGLQLISKIDKPQNRSKSLGLPNYEQNNENDSNDASSCPGWLRHFM
jgi:hypothetical protein